MACHLIASLAKWFFLKFGDHTPTIHVGLNGIQVDIRIHASLVVFLKISWIQCITEIVCSRQI
jgi:hypothetical protein